jgi:transposase
MSPDFSPLIRNPPVEEIHHDLDWAGVEPTNNRAERALRFAVLWRKRSNGTQSEKGNRWVERLLSFRQTCRLRGQASFPLLVDAVKAYFKEQTPNMGWLA